ncbi:MAG TPA: antibiotic biosynthesis monooxygenase family protein [Actinokineospora sp.]|jgi:heme-degrading monooxygenase HmoA|nr:antibiotic biosynthesis monooxygenase family protein [Actinokineospora sp.]
MSEIRIFIYHATDDVEGVEQAYHEVSKELVGVPGMLGNDLMRSVHDPLGFVVMSRWVDMDAFNEWEQGPAHKGQTSALRKYRDTRPGAVPFALYEVTASY